MIVGMMVEKAAGIPWERLIHERPCDPLGLPSAAFGPQATTGPIDAPVGHRIEDNREVTVTYWRPAADVTPLVGPAGAVHLSITDLVKWAAWNAGDGKREPALVGPETLKMIQEPHVQVQPGALPERNYAMGWGIVEVDWADKPLLTHTGSNSMNLAKATVDGDNDLAIVATTNFPGHDAEAAVKDVVERLYRT